MAATLRPYDPGPAVPLAERPDVRFALVRRERWLEQRTVRVAVADLVHGTYEEDDVDTGTVMPAVHAWLDERIAVLRARVDGKPEPGLQCAWCPYIAGCPPMSGRG